MIRIPNNVPPLPVRRWRKAKEAFKEAKTHENAVEIQREQRAIADWRRENIKVAGQAGS